MKKYRVDRVNSLSVPCGMNSIRYFGNSLQRAKKAWKETKTGLDAWDQPNSGYGVILSEWTGEEYKIIASKGLSDRLSTEYAFTHYPEHT